ARRENSCRGIGTPLAQHSKIPNENARALLRRAPRCSSVAARLVTQGCLPYFVRALGPDEHARLAPWVAASSEEEGYQRTQTHEKRRPYIQAQTEHGVRRVDPDHLDPQPPRRVDDHVQPEHPAVAEPEAAVRPHQE